MSEQTQQTQQQQNSNLGYNMASALHVRLNTQQLIDSCKQFLSGTMLVIEKEGNKIITKEIPVGRPKMNTEGVAAVVNRINLILSNAVVQGNYDYDRYKHEIYTIRISLANELMTNLYNWGIDIKEFSGIVDSLMTPIKAYLSRLIDNKERESYDTTLKVLESSQVQQKGGFRI